jgi:hypothetical protein
VSEIQYGFSTVICSHRGQLWGISRAKGSKAFTAYAIASAKDHIPEMENAARLTLDHPMTFEILGEGLQLFEGWALHILVNYHKRCRDNLVTCVDSFLKVHPSGVWVDNHEVIPARGWGTYRQYTIPRWLNQLILQNKNDLRFQKFTCPLDTYSRIHREYVMALQDHEACDFCLGVVKRHGPTFCMELENKLVQALDKVTYSLYFFACFFGYHEIYFS